MRARLLFAVTSEATARELFCQTALPSHQAKELQKKYKKYSSRNVSLQPIHQVS
jgi:hypothetical protein